MAKRLIADDLKCITLFKDLSLFFSEKESLKLGFCLILYQKNDFKQLVELYGEFLERDAFIKNCIDCCENHL